MTKLPHKEDARPIIKVAAGELPRQYDETVAALRSADAPLYSFAGRLVRAARRQDSISASGLARPAGLLELCPISAPALHLEIDRAARFVRYDRRSDDWVATAPPARLIEALVDAPDRAEWPSVAAVKDHPVIALPSGRIIEQEGLDHRSSVLLDFSGWGWPYVRRRPTHAEAREAVSRLCDFLKDMPLVGETDVAVALSAILTAVLGPMLPTRPAHAFDAAAPGSGKTLLADCIGIIATGSPPATIEWARDPDEASKRVDAAQMAGIGLLNVDNVESPLGGPTLCQMISAEVRSVRPLGRSEIVTVPVRSTVIATGNNLVIRADAVRRFLVARLDAGVEQPDRHRCRYRGLAHRARRFRSDDAAQ